MKTIALSMVLLAPGAYAQFGTAANAFQSAFEEASTGASPSVTSGTYMFMSALAQR
jgi:hypothetical protein